MTVTKDTIISDIKIVMIDKKGFIKETEIFEFRPSLYWAMPLRMPPMFDTEGGNIHGVDESRRFVFDFKRKTRNYYGEEILVYEERKD